MAKHVKGAWFFCRGIFKQHINSFVLYRELGKLRPFSPHSSLLPASCPPFPRTRFSHPWGVLRGA